MKFVPDGANSWHVVWADSPKYLKSEKMTTVEAKIREPFKSAQKPLETQLGKALGEEVRVDHKQTGMNMPPSPRLSEKHLVMGIAFNGTDSAACLLKDGILIAAVEEERFTRKRHDGSFPTNSIRWCLDFANASPSEIQKIGVSWDYQKYEPADSSGSPIRRFYRSLEDEGYPINWQDVDKHIQKFRVARFMQPLQESFQDLATAHIQFYTHHDCHAASTYCFSGFESSLVAVMDEKGEQNTISLYAGRGTSLKVIDRLTVPNSLGLYYAAATEFLGFTPFKDEGTFMALAAKGTPNPELRSWLLSDVVKNTGRGIEVDPEMVSKSVFDYKRTGESFYTSKMIDGLSQFRIYPPHQKGIFEQTHESFAFEIQHVLEHVALEYLGEKAQVSGIDRLCMAGGVGLNCALNGKISKSNVHELFVPPWCHDAGGAIGAGVLALSNEKSHDMELAVPQYERLTRADWGPSYENDDLSKALELRGLPSIRASDIAKETAKLLAEGKIVAWFQGRAEFGPRALGQRSILSHPHYPGNKERLIEIKQRLPFRPFAPSIIQEHATDYSEIRGTNTEFMASVFAATKAAMRDIPDALCDADSTLRPQVVAPGEAWLYHDLLKEFYKLTQIPAILNTSFNVNEPTVLTPGDAISTFVRSKIDVLVMGNHIIHKFSSRVKDDKAHER